MKKKNLGALGTDSAHQNLNGRSDKLQNFIKLVSGQILKCTHGSFPLRKKVIFIESCTILDIISARRFKVN